MRRILIGAVLCLVVAACGDDDGDQVTSDVSDLIDAVNDMSQDDADLDEMLDQIEEEEMVEPVQLPPGTGSDFAAICVEEDWDEDLAPATVGDF